MATKLLELQPYKTMVVHALINFCNLNSQNNWYWGAENPRCIHKLPLHDEKIGVWCAISASRIIGHIFYNDTLNGARYVNKTQSQFFAKPTEEERLYGVFGDCVISCGLWPPSSPDLTPCDFYLWGILQDKVYKTNPHTLEKLRSNVRLLQFLWKNSTE
jgi:hypothetical protein